MEGPQGQLGGQPRPYPPPAMFSHEDEAAGHFDTAEGAKTGSDVSSGQVPDALAHLLSAAEAASSEGK